MKEINVADIVAEVRRLCIEAACDLPRDVEKLIHQATETEESEFGTYAMEKICRNIKIARENNVPMCQDTGMVIAFVEIGQEVHITGGLLDDAINAGVAAGYVDGYLRKSTVVARYSTARTPATTRPPSSTRAWWPATSCASPSCRRARVRGT